MNGISVDRVAAAVLKAFSRDQISSGRNLETAADCNLFGGAAFTPLQPFEARKPIVSPM